MSRNITVETINWQGITLSVSFEPKAFGLEWNAHLQIEALSPKRVRLPMSETGYRSHFCHPDEVAAAGGPTAYVRAWLEGAAKGPEWLAYQEANRQLSLF